MGLGLNYVVSLLSIFIGSLISVAFFIVVERKGLGHFQLRHGPNKPGIKGIIQALADGVKLMCKDWFIPSSANKGLFVMGPVFMFCVSFGGWVILPIVFTSFYFKTSLLYYLSLGALSVYGVFMCGWSSNSQYSMLGSMRALAQSISYEVIMGTILFCPCMFIGGLSIFSFLGKEGIYMGLMVEVFCIWWIVLLAETNRAPFDFVEGESELVAGFNVEYGGFGFALIALAEYGSIFFSSVLTGAIFMGGCMKSLLLLGFIGVWSVLLSYVFILVRATLPRYRYDKLMEFSWKELLPLSLGLLSINIFEFWF
uniref:NADH-ubiquinone oxidoreductase chain 1 n=1 Tax=Hiatella sp. J YW-2023 TaxID=3074278 RepID=A0AA51YKC9_9BIVA|nr:NADH dehydrogenase subunit 1 [Hiatella sp. J YW-2023]